MHFHLHCRFGTLTQVEDLSSSCTTASRPVSEVELMNDESRQGRAERERGAQRGEQMSLLNITPPGYVSPAILYTSVSQSFLFLFKNDKLLQPN